MRDRLLSAASGVARFVMVVAAFGLAVGSIGLSATRGFCPEGPGQPAALAAGPASLATIVEDAPEGVDPESPAPPDEGPQDGPATPEESPAEDADGACPGGVSRCLPPLVSSVLILGEPACNEQAPARLRGTLVPAFVGATVLFAGAWWLRPTRLHDRLRDDTPAGTG